MNREKTEAEKVIDHSVMHSFSGSEFATTAQDARALIQQERGRQEAKWGEQNHDPFTYLTILMEEVGELSQSALHTKFGGDAAPGLLNEAVQTAAVAQAIVECLLRGKWAWPKEVHPHD